MKKKGKGQAPVFKGAARIVNKILSALTLVLGALLLYSVVFARVTGQPAEIVGHRLYIVLSGSMSPAFESGSLVVVKKSAPEEISSGDVITYRGLGEEGQLVSHRVVAVNKSEKNGLSFTTKGDANEAADPNPTPGKNLVGKVVVAIPYLGYFMEYTKTKQGLVAVIIIPALILLLWELGGLYKYGAQKKKEEAQPSNRARLVGSDCDPVPGEAEKFGRES